MTAFRKQWFEQSLRAKQVKPLEHLASLVAQHELESKDFSPVRSASSVAHILKEHVESWRKLSVSDARDHIEASYTRQWGFFDFPPEVIRALDFLESEEIRLAQRHTGRRLVEWGDALSFLERHERHLDPIAYARLHSVLTRGIAELSAKQEE